MQQQDERASRPKLSAADDTVLKLSLRALGEGHFLTASLVCTAWRHAYSAIVRQSKLTCCKPYVQDAAMWAHIKELDLHESIPADLVGQFGCDSALADRVGSALDKLDLRQLVAEDDSDLDDAVASPLLDEEESSEDETAPVETAGEREAGQRAHLIAQRTAKQEAERIAKQEIVSVTETIMPIVTGAAKGGRYTVCASTLAKLPQTTADAYAELLKSVVRALVNCAAYAELLKSVVRALVNCAAKCIDVTTFNLMLRALLVVCHCDVPVAVDAGRPSKASVLHEWELAAECSEQHCDAALPQFALELKQSCDRKYYYSSFQLDDAATMVYAMWRIHDVKTAFTWALVRCGIPALHAHFIREFASHPRGCCNSRIRT
jgi:hypothetical protein